MRVISGKRRGHNLKAPMGNKVRPTEGRVKESLFNILGPIPTNSIVLDAFAGTGSIGIEFLSRGAKECYFVDKSNESIKYIKENIDHTKFQKESHVYREDVLRFLVRASKLGIKFDFIYIDPPFGEMELATKLMNSILEYDILSDSTLIMIEHDEDIEINKKYNLYDKRKYGRKYISFYKLDNKEE